MTDENVNIGQINVDLYVESWILIPKGNQRNSTLQAESVRSGAKI